jgi:hypothetical protein
LRLIVLFPLDFISIYGILASTLIEEVVMSRLSYAKLARKPMDVLDMTSLTPDEFDILVPPFEQAFQAHMADWRLDGKPRTARRFTTYKNCPLPTAEDRLLFILIYLKTHPLQVAHGIMFDLPQGKTNQWLQVLLLCLRNALRTLGDAPARSLVDLATRLGVSEADVAAVLASAETDASADQAAEQPAAASASPLFVMMAPNDVSRAPKMHLNRKASIAARKSIIASKICC